jgi:hypothetical protein
VRKRSKINLHHAAATALVAWILIVPPQLAKTGHPDQAVPFSKWEQMGSYNSAAECNADRVAFIKRDQKEYKLSLGSASSAAAQSPGAARQDALKSTAALCISDDDPLLQKK